MVKNVLGIGAGLTMGVALFAAPVYAGTISPGTVGSVDNFIGSCWVDDPTLSGNGLANEINCINREIGHETGIDGTFVKADALKIETLNFALVLDGENDTWAQKLTDEFGVSSEGGWFSIKTGGNITCDESKSAFLLGECVQNEQHYLIFENLDNLLYAVVDLGDLLMDYGIDVNNDILRFSHITVVPLPAAAFLFGSALLGGGLLRRRKMIKKYGLPA